jgi:hypothetical protein
MGLLFGCITLATGVAAAQAPPIHGFNGTLALPENVDKFYSNVHKLVVLTADGIDHVIDGTEDSGARGESASLETLQPGTQVTVHYTVEGIAASPRDKPNEAIVTSVDDKRVTILFSSGATQTLRYTRRATRSSEGDVRHGDRVVVSSLDESGRKRVYYFKPRPR